MKVEYRQLFLKELKKLKKQPTYQKIKTLIFDTLPNESSIQEMSNVKAIVGQPNRYRIRVGDYRVGVEINGDITYLARVLHRKDFYRYFP